MTLSEELTWRGFVNQTTYKDITVLDGDPIIFYFGVDPSAKSMHVGQLAMTILIKHFINHGHKPILLVGGATGLIGDPDGKDTERDIKTVEEVESNKAGIASQYKKIFEDYDIEIVDNYDWFKNIGYLQFLRDIGKHVPMSQMLGREFIQTRLGEGGNGISYAEFSYALIQGYDFLHLFKQKGVKLQVCGSDQWGNSIAGVELVRRIEGQEVDIWSAPLVINKATGKKFGKSEGGAIWLEEQLTSVYKFYQFWLNTDDISAIDYLKMFTFKNKQEIDDIGAQFNASKDQRLAQKVLAYEVTKIVHGQARADSVKKISDVLFGGGPYSDLTKDDFKELSREIGLQTITLNSNLHDIAVGAGLASSKSQSRQFLKSGAYYLNGNKLADTAEIFTPNMLINGYGVLRRGKNAQTVIWLA